MKFCLRWNSFLPAVVSKLFKLKLKHRMAVYNNLVVIFGCSGTGKSDLGVQLAKHFDGEIISADSMQIYKGLDISTNKIRESEMENIPHHLMSFLDPSDSTFNIHSFREKAIQIIEELWKVNKLPILVGGTTYYVESVIFKDYLIETNSLDYVGSNFDSYSKYSNDDLHDRLKNVDLDSANQIHPNNRTRIIRALQIFELTGRKKSDFLREQFERHKSSACNGLRYPNTILFFLDGEKQMLNELLNHRVHKMMENGLRNEIEEFYDKHHSNIGRYGIFQSIALKEFEKYLVLSKEERHTDQGDSLFIQGCEDLKLHSRKLARRQRMWINQRLLGQGRRKEKFQIVRMDVCKENFDSIVSRTIEKVQQFLTSPQASFCDKERGILDEDYQRMANQMYYCESCKKSIHGISSWTSHLDGKKHKNMVRKQKRKRGNYN